MGRLVGYLTLFALIGAAASYAVAWGCAMTLEFDGFEVLKQHGLPAANLGPSSNVTVLTKPGRQHIDASFWNRDSPYEPKAKDAAQMVPTWGRVSTFDRLALMDRETNFYTMVDEASGWPCLSHWHGWGPTDQFAPTGIVSGLEVKSPGPSGIGSRALPLAPIWPGFLLNTAFYSVILWALWFTPVAIKRTLRKRRGACVRCGYDLRGAGLAEACPECGVVSASQGGEPPR